MNNPLLNMRDLPPFSKIKPEHIEPAIDALLQKNRQTIETLLAATSAYTWDNLVQPLDEMAEHLARTWSPVNHLNSVLSSDELRDAYNLCLAKLSEYNTDLQQHSGLYKAFKHIAESADYQALNVAQKKIIDNTMRDFHLSGIDLPDTEKARYKAIMQALSPLISKFNENILDAANAWKIQIKDEAHLKGLPESALGMAKQIAQREKLDGWVFNLEPPSYLSIMTYADDRELRREIYTAFITHASDKGPNAGEWDNSPLMEEILSLRHEASQLLGFDNYAERSLATKMVHSTDQVMAFLNDLADHSLPVAKRELAELRAYAKGEYGADELKPWDIDYYAEKLKQHKYAISQEALKPYFPEDAVLKGMFYVIERLYGMQVSERNDIDVWHQDVRFFDIHDAAGELRGRFYLDSYARPKKRGLPWADACITRMATNKGVQIPVAYLTCSFSPPIGDDPALFRHDEVAILFHEFGHCLHHMLSQMDYLGVSVLGGVPVDAVEFPSQFMENWCWQREALDVMSGHYKTGEPLPQVLFDKMIAAKNHLSAMQMVHQLEKAMFDFRTHLEYDPAKGARILEILDDVRKHVAVIEPLSFDRFTHSFFHMFSDGYWAGYAAGYYSYHWAEVLSADAFSLFEENGIFDRETGLKFLSTVLEQGGSREPMDLFVEFRGREPTIDAFLRQKGLVV
ncbi:oligopeptidase A [Pseudomonadota bacterium]